MPGREARGVVSIVIWVAEAYFGSCPEEFGAEVPGGSPCYPTTEGF